jgi:MFS family permease
MRDNGIRRGYVAKPPGISFPWVVVLLGALLLMSAYIYTYTFGVFFKPIAVQFDWGRAEMSASYAIRSLVAAALVVPMGHWADRYGPRRVLLPSFILIGVSLMAVARVTNLWQLYLLQGACVGIGSAGPFACVLSTVAKWHDTRRGLALGMASAGIGLTSIVFPPVATKLIEAHGWPLATFVIGLIILALGIPSSLIIRDPPNASKQPSSGKSAGPKGLLHAWGLLPQFLRNPAFLAIVILFVLISAVGQMLLNHLVNYATDTGISTLAAAGMMSALGAASTIGRLGIGFVSDKIGAKRDAALCCVLLAVSFVLLILKVPALMWMAAVLFGIGFGGSVTLIPALMAERVRLERLGAATGVGTMGAFIGAAIGPWLGGLIFDASGSYLWALVLAAGGSLAAFIVALRLPAARRIVPQ